MLASFDSQQAKDSEEHQKADEVFDPSIFLQTINEGNHPITETI